MKIKIFESVNESVVILESKINKWLSDNNHIKIHKMTQSESGFDKDNYAVTISFLYYGEKE